MKRYKKYMIQKIQLKQVQTEAECFLISIHFEVLCKEVRQFKKLKADPPSSLQAQGTCSESQSLDKIRYGPEHQPSKDVI